MCIGQMLNIICFVDGAEDPIKSGGTGIYADPDLKDLANSQNTKNSALIYNSTFFHGFDIMSKNSFRKAITFQFKAKYEKF